MFAVRKLAGAAVTLAALAGCSSTTAEPQAASRQSPPTTATTAPATEDATAILNDYDLGTDPSFSFDERAYLLLIEMDSAAAPGSNLDLSSTDMRLGPMFAQGVIDRGRTACDGAAQGDSAQENMDLLVEFGGLTPGEAQLVLNVAVTTLCPEYIGSGT